MRTLLTLLCLLLSVTEARRRLEGEVSLSNSTDWSRELLGKNVDVPKATSPDDHLVTDLPLLDSAKFSTKHWAGLLPASGNGDKYLFYWLFAPAESNKDDEDIPLIIWLNGGPACSSMDGLWLENGPFRLVKSENKWNIDFDEHSWHHAPAYVVYIDQPVGTGISFTTSAKYPTNDREVNVDFYYFLKEFLKLHADKFLDDSKSTMTRKLFFSGESHAGHYIPSMMNFIQKKNAQSPDLTIPLEGAAIGNGWIDPMVQYSAHEAAYGYGLIGLAQKRYLEAKEKKCQQSLASGSYVNNVCYSLLDSVVDNSMGSSSGYKVSVYDQRKQESTGKSRDFPPGHKDVEAYLSGNGPMSSDFKKVLEAIHSTPSWKAGQEYRECTNPPFNALKHQDGKGVTQDVVDLLNNGVRMLFFNGIHDLICNHVGNEIAVENFEWDHQVEYQQAKRYAWNAASTKKLGGYMKEYQNLMYLKVLDSGHMVPMDVPNVGLDMMRTFVTSASFDSFEQKISRTKVSHSDGDTSQCPVCPQQKECDECPECESKGTEDDDSEPGDDDSKKPIPTPAAGDQVPASVFAFFGLASFGLGIAMFWLCTSCGRKPKKVSRYDVELSGNGYRDNEIS